MIGYLQDGIAKALKAYEPLKLANIEPIRAIEGDSAVINTPLPAIVIHIIGVDGEGNTFIGGGIRQYYSVQLWVLNVVTNFTFTKDNGLQAKMLDISDEVIRCIENTTLLDTIKQTVDLQMQFDRIESDVTYGSKGAQAVTVDVQKIIYECSVEFNRFPADYVSDANLDAVEINNNVNTSNLP